MKRELKIQKCVFKTFGTNLYLNIFVLLNIYIFQYTLTLKTKRNLNFQLQNLINMEG